MAYVYRHIRLDKNEPFYIGVGGLITFDNYKRSKSKGKRTAIWRKIVTKSKYEVEILMDNLTKEEALEKEVEFIALYGRIDKNTGILANMTDGGDGGIGHIVPESVKIYLRELYSGKPRPEHVRKAMSRLGWNHTEESKKKIGNSIKGEKNGFYGRKHTKETLDKLSKMAKVQSQNGKNPFDGKSHKKETIEKMSNIIINLETGIFYSGIIEASFVSNTKYSTLRSMLNGNNRNRTSFKYCQ